jgi:hypothetical protein
MEIPSIQQIVQDFTRFATDFYTKKEWGSITVVFRSGVPMSIERAISNRVLGPEQTAVATGGKTHGRPEYR